MKYEFLSKFDKDIDNILDKSVLENIAEVIEDVGLANDITELKGVKKLVGFKYAYRIKMGKYRIGFFIKMTLLNLPELFIEKIFTKYFRKLL